MYNIPLTILVIVVMILLLIGCFAISMVLFKRAVFSVINVFWEYNAVEEKNAITTEQLGCKPRTLQNFLNPGLRDYKIEALEFLLANFVVQLTNDHKFYLCEERLFAIIPMYQLKLN